MSPELQTLLHKLRNPAPVERVRLVRETKVRYEQEFPEAAKGAAQAAGANRSRASKKGNVTPNSGVTPFAEWLAEQLNLGVTTVRTQITRARWIPEEALCDIESRGNVPRVGELLEQIAKQMLRDHSTDWRLVIEAHLQPPALRNARGLYLIGDSAFMSRDVRSQLEAKPRRLFDAIITDPPYGMRHKGIVNGEMTDDRKGALWAVPLMARWVKPDGAVCLWCNGGKLGKWTAAVLDAGLVISGLVHWSKSRFLDGRGEEVMIVAGHQLVTVPEWLRTIAVPTLPKDAPERQVHDTPKPLDLFTPIIAALTRPGDYVFDPFAGTGVVGEACMRAGRNYVGAELDDKVARYAVLRLKKVDRELRVAAAAE